jgi:uncharacterized protein (TIGR02147 family)
MALPDIFQYFDYRSFLRDAQLSIKEDRPAFTFEFLALAVGLKARSHITLLIQGKKNMPKHLIPLFSKALGLEGRHGPFFEALVHFTQARTHSEKKTWLDRMITIQYGQTRTLDTRAYELCKKWYYPIVREVLRIMAVNENLAEVGARIRPRIGVSEVRESLQVLERLNLAFRDPKGRWRQTSAQISFSDGWRSVAVREFQLHSLEQAKLALETVPAEEREIAMVTLTTSPELALRIRERMREFRAEIVGMVTADENNPTSVQQIILCAFPLTIEGAP